MQQLRPSSLHKSTFWRHSFLGMAKWVVVFRWEETVEISFIHMYIFNTMLENILQALLV